MLRKFCLLSYKKFHGFLTNGHKSLFHKFSIIPQRMEHWYMHTVSRDGTANVSVTGVPMCSLQTEDISQTWKCNLAATFEKRLSFRVAADLTKTPEEWSGRTDYEINCQRKNKENIVRFQFTRKTVPRTHFQVSFLTGEVLQFFLLIKN